ncbi:Protease, Ulp1 family [Phaffia rhodozyma]|uniref:Protease, Ulp1 family n=1 Tax=Phaffia rhodozyma TaxID=264483 RepID=A0A0F7SHT2_PHARH|nr:Protease, Ulp1 family [Phaffia rhodozyma]
MPNHHHHSSPFYTPSTGQRAPHIQKSKSFQRALSDLLPGFGAKRKRPSVAAPNDHMAIVSTSSSTNVNVAGTSTPGHVNRPAPEHPRTNLLNRIALSSNGKMSIRMLDGSQTMDMADDGDEEEEEDELQVLDIPRSSNGIIIKRTRLPINDAGPSEGSSRARLSLSNEINSMGLSKSDTNPRPRRVESADSRTGPLQTPIYETEPKPIPIITPQPGQRGPAQLSYRQPVKRSSAINSPFTLGRNSLSTSSTPLSRPPPTISRSPVLAVSFNQSTAHSALVERHQPSVDVRISPSMDPSRHNYNHNQSYRQHQIKRQRFDSPTKVPHHQSGQMTSGEVERDHWQDIAQTGCSTTPIDVPDSDDDSHDPINSFSPAPRYKQSSNPLPPSLPTHTPLRESFEPCPIFAPERSRRPIEKDMATVRNRDKEMGQSVRKQQEAANDRASAQQSLLKFSTVVSPRLASNLKSRSGESIKPSSSTVPKVKKKIETSFLKAQDTRPINIGDVALPVERSSFLEPRVTKLCVTSSSFQVRSMQHVAFTINFADVTHVMLSEEYEKPLLLQVEYREKASGVTSADKVETKKAVFEISIDGSAVDDWERVPSLLVVGVDGRNVPYSFQANNTESRFHEMWELLYPNKEPIPIAIPRQSTRSGTRLAAPAERAQKSEPKPSAEDDPALHALSRPPPPVDPETLMCMWPAKGRGEINITKGDFYRTTWDAEYLNDTIIEFGLKETFRRAVEKRPQLTDEVHIFNSFLYMKLTDRNVIKSGKDPWETVKRWTNGKVDLFSKKYIVVPINEEYHWYCAVIVNPSALLRDPAVQPEVKDVEAAGAVADGNDGADQEMSGADAPASSVPYVLIFDSFGTPRSEPRKVLTKYLRSEAGFHKAWGEKEVTPLETKKVDVPLQPDYSSCGVYLLHYIEVFFDDPEAALEKILHPIPNRNKATRTADRNEFWRQSELPTKRESIKNQLLDLQAEWRKENGIEDGGSTEALPSSVTASAPSSTAISGAKKPTDKSTTSTSVPNITSQPSPRSVPASTSSSVSQAEESSPSMVNLRQIIPKDSSGPTQSLPDKKFTRSGGVVSLKGKLTETSLEIPRREDKMDVEPGVFKPQPPEVHELMDSSDEDGDS